MRKRSVYNTRILENIEGKGEGGWGRQGAGREGPVHVESRWLALDGSPRSAGRARCALSTTVRGSAVS